MFHSANNPSSVANANPTDAIRARTANGGGFFGRLSGIVSASTIVAAMMIASCTSTVGEMTEDTSASTASSDLAGATLTASETSETLSVAEQGGKVVVKTSGGKIVTWFALPEQQGDLTFDWQGWRYRYQAASGAKTLTAVGTSGALVVGGTIAPGTRIGLPNYETGNGSTQPHILVYHGVTGSEPVTVRYSVTDCINALCDPEPGPLQAQTTVGAAVTLNEIYGLAFQADDTSWDGTQVAFAVKRLNDETPTPCEQDGCKATLTAGTTELAEARLGSSTGDAWTDDATDASSNTANNSWTDTATDTSGASSTTWPDTTATGSSASYSGTTYPTGPLPAAAKQNKSSNTNWWLALAVVAVAGTALACHFEVGGFCATRLYPAPVIDGTALINGTK